MISYRHSNASMTELPALLTLRTLAAAAAAVAVLTVSTPNAWSAESQPSVKVATAQPATSDSQRDLIGQEIAKKVRQWSFGMTASDGPLMPNSASRHDNVREYDLINFRFSGNKSRYLQYEKTGSNGGINLDFTDNSKQSTGSKVSNWYFVRHSDRTGPIVYGERLAMGYMADSTKNNPYIQYGHRDFGINLKWSKESVYEWVILGGTRGTVVQTRDKVALFNTKHDNFMIYFHREDFPTSHAGDIGWPDSKSLLDTIKGKLADELKGAAKDAAKCMAKEYLGMKCSA